ncbi:MAG: hypothetical protein ACKVS7_10260 [Gemmatimonadaceae bacterium]
MTECPHFYTAFGEQLESSIPFDELEHCARTESSAPRWSLREVAALEPMRDAVARGSDEIYRGVFARLHAHAEGHRITIDDTGIFDLPRDGGAIRFVRRDDASPEFVRAHLLGRVLGTAIYLDGGLPLHASAVAFPHGAIGFIAPKGFGKSSLALALLRHQAGLLTDDTLRLSLGHTVLAWPGVQRMRLHEDAAGHLALPSEGNGAEIGNASARDGKRLLRVGAAQRATAPVPLLALYTLAPDADPLAPVERAALSPMAAAVALVSHVKIGAMLGAHATGAMLQRAAHITRNVAVMRLRVPRAHARLDEVAQALHVWHRPSA